MADDNKRYYWLKMPESFFCDIEIKKLRRIAGGDIYTIIYLKLMLLSLENKGYLYYQGIENTLVEELALVLDEEPDNVRFTLMYLKQMGLLVETSQLDIYMSQVPEMIGSETESAKRKRKQRNRERLGVGCDIVPALSQNVPAYKNNSNIHSNIYDDDCVRSHIHTQINYQHLYDMLDYVGRNILQDVVADMIDVYINTSDKIYIKKGEAYPAEHVRAKYDTIDADIMMHIIERLRNANIGTDARSYIRTTTYNATKTIDTQYNADARHGR